MIADLEAKLSLATEREFYLSAENARLRAQLIPSALSEAQRNLVIEVYANQKLRAECLGYKKSMLMLRGIVVEIARLVRPNRKTEKTSHAVQRILEENETLRMDSARLDWLSKKASNEIMSFGPTVRRDEHWVCDKAQNNFGPTLRDAIDAAMQEAKQ